MPDIEETPVAETGNQVVGKVFILYGTAKAISTDGTVRILEPNSLIYADDRIITESDGNVSIVLDGPVPTQLDIGRMSDIVIDEDVYGGVGAEDVAAAAAEAEEIQQALLAGDEEADLDMEATAAGGVSSAGGGLQVFSVDATGGEVTPQSGAETTGITTGTVDPIEGEVTEPAAPVNNPPEFLSGEDTPSTPPNVDVYYFNALQGTEAGTPIGTAPAYDADGDTLTYSIESGNEGGLFSINSSTGEISVTEDIDDAQLGDYGLGIKVVDGQGGEDVATVNVSLTNVNDPPEVGDATARVSEEGLDDGIEDDVGTPEDLTNAAIVGGTITITDADGDPLTVTLTAPSEALESNGTPITWLGNGTQTLIGQAGGENVIIITVDNDGNYQVSLEGPIDHDIVNVEDVKSFDVTVNVSDGTATSEGTLTVIVEDDSPEAVDHTPIVEPPEDTAILIDVNADITAGADGVDLGSGVAVTTGPTKGTVQYNGDGTFTYTPTAGETGSDSFVYTVTDGDLDTDTATVNILLDEDSKPAAVADSAIVDESDLPGIGSGLNPEDQGPPVDQYSYTTSGNVLDNDTWYPGTPDEATITSVNSVEPISGVITVDTPTGLLKVYVTDEAANAAKSGETAGYYEYTLQAATDDGVNDSETFNYVLTDGDTSYTSPGVLTINILDDEPTLGDFMEGTIPNEIGSVNGLFDVTPGADGIATFNITGPTLPNIGYSSETTTVNGITSTTLTATSTVGDPDTIFSLTVREDGTYTFNLVKPDTATTETLSLTTLDPGGPGFGELSDDINTAIDETGRIEFTGSASGVNANNNGFGVSNTWVNPGEWFTMEFHNPGSVGDEPPETNPEYLSAITININRLKGGDATVQWEAYNTLTAATDSGTFVITSTGDYLIDPSIEFNQIKITNIDDLGNPDDGGDFSASYVEITKTILPSDQDLNFEITATDGDDDVTSTSYLDIHVVAGADSFTLTGTGADDAIAGSSLPDTITGGDGFDIVDYSEDTANLNVNLETNTGSGGAAAGDTYISIEGALGGSGDDTLIGNSSANYLDGGAGDDTLTGGDDADTFKAGEGNDTIKDYDKDTDGDLVDISDVFDSSAGDYLAVSDDGSNNAKLSILDEFGAEKGSITFDDIDYDTLGSDPLGSLLGQVNIDYDGDGEPG